MERLSFFTRVGWYGTRIWRRLSIFTILNLSLIARSTVEETAVKFENVNEYEPLPGKKRTQSRKPGGYREDSRSWESVRYNR